MKIDLTLLVQALNFFIVYFLVERLFIRPASARIIENRLRIDQMNSDVAKEHATLRRLQDENQAIWQKCQLYLKDHSPEISLEKRAAQMQDLSIDQRIFSDEAIKATINRLSQELIERLDDVR